MLQRVIPDAQVLSVGGPYGIDADLAPEVWLGNSEEEASEDLLATETCPPTESRFCALPGAAEEEVSGEGKRWNFKFRSRIMRTRFLGDDL